MLCLLRSYVSKRTQRCFFMIVMISFHFFCLGEKILKIYGGRLNVPAFWGVPGGSRPQKGALVIPSESGSGFKDVPLDHLTGRSSFFYVWISVGNENCPLFNWDASPPSSGAAFPPLPRDVPVLHFCNERKRLKSTISVFLKYRIVY